MTSFQERLAVMEKRLHLLEDQAAIYQILACYGPAADSGSSQRAAQLWTEDGVYDLHTQIMQGQQDIVNELEGEWHQGLIHQGSAHIMSLPYVTINGDEAVATGYSRLYRREDDAFKVLSCSANRWELTRTPQGWRVKQRITRRLNGSEDSHALFARGVQEDIAS